MREYFRNLLLALLCLAISYQYANGRVDVDHLKKELQSLFEDTSPATGGAADRSSQVEYEPIIFSPLDVHSLKEVVGSLKKTDSYVLSSLPAKTTEEHEKSRQEALTNKDLSSLFLLQLNSDHPSESPSESPTAAQSDIPTEDPTVFPSRLPTPQPSGRPSNKPFGSPTYFPSGHPSAQPTVFPSRKPSVNPSALPSRDPTSQPTDRPSNLPTSQPSADPTSRPSGVPSSFPSSCPSPDPTSQPTGQPSNLPSSLPSTYPTSLPSSAPSSFPSSSPSRDPTSKPTNRPNNRPTSQPSTYPTSQPSSAPSKHPLSIPSAIPSEIPSAIPSTFPSSQPTVVPSLLPTSLPSSRPTSAPSKHPTPFPLVSSAPSLSLARSPVPTFSPSSNTPMLSFSTNLTLTGLSSPTLSDKDQVAVINSTADSMGISPSYVTITNEIATAISTDVVKLFLRRILGTKYAIIVITEFHIPLEGSQLTNSTSLFNALKQMLSSAVSSGRFTSTLNRISIEIGANDTAGATALNITFSPPSVTAGYQPTASNDDHHSLLTVGAIIGIAIGGAAFIAMLAASSYYYYFHYLNWQPKRMGGRAGGDSFNRSSSLFQRYESGKGSIIRPESISPRFASYDMVEEQLIDEEFGLERSPTRKPSIATSPFRFEGVNPLSPSRRGSSSKYITNSAASERRESIDSSAVGVPLKDEDDPKEKEWSIKTNSVVEVEIYSLLDIDLFYDATKDGKLDEDEDYENQSIWSQENHAIHEDQEVAEEEFERHINKVVDRSDLTSPSRKSPSERGGMADLLASWEVETSEEPDSNVELGFTLADPISFRNPQRIQIDTRLVELDSISVETPQLTRESYLPPFSIPKMGQEGSRYGVMNDIDDGKGEEDDEHMMEGISTKRPTLNQRSKSSESRSPNQHHENNQIVNRNEESRFVLYHEGKRL